MTTTTARRVTPEEYLAIERADEWKNEYRDGMIVPMTHESLLHSDLVRNVACALHPQLKGRPCQAYMLRMRVKVSATGLYTFPDLVAVCAEPELEDEHWDTLLNPVLILEVLSPSTEAFDRGDKFEHYRQLPTLREYVLVSQHRIRVERFERQPGETWLYTAVVQPDAVLHLPSIACDLRMADVYANVTFPAEETPEGE